MPGGCERCGRFWECLATADLHVTLYGDGNRGLFPLCERCWGELTPEGRLPFYARLFDYWIAAEPEIIAVWPAIEKAVLEGG